MRKRWMFLASLIVAFMALSAAFDRQRSSTRVAIGTVAEVHAGDWLLVTNNSMRLPVGLHETTVYDGNPAGIRSGTRVAVWYRNVAERRLAVDKVRLLDAPAR